MARSLRVCSVDIKTMDYGVTWRRGNSTNLVAVRQNLPLAGTDVQDVLRHN